MLTIKTWNGHDINDGTSYIAGFSPGAEWGLPDVTVNSVQRIGVWPATTTISRDGRMLSVFVSIEDATSVRTLRGQLLRWFDPEDETPHALVITDDDTGVDRYVMAICQQARPINVGPVSACGLFRISLMVDGDVRWRSVATDSDTWSITATADTNVIANGGEDEAYPIITLEPTTGKTGGYDYRRWVAVVWRSQNSGNQYPLMTTLDTDALNTAGKMQADLDDLRVLVDGSQTYRWCDPAGVDDAATKIWWSMDFSRAPELTLAVAIAGAGVISSIQVDDEVELSLMPESGIALIGSEAFVYTGRNLTDKQLTGITREAKNTTIAAHNIGDTVHWIQHDVYLLYGNATATAPTVDDDYMPVFELDISDNETWEYEEFGESLKPRAAPWINGNNLSTSDYGCYTGSEWGYVEPWVVLGAFLYSGSGPNAFSQSWQLSNPCGIVNVAWTGGKIRSSVVDSTVSWQLRYWKRGAAWWSTMENGYWQLSTDPLPAINTWYSQGGAGWLTDFGDANAADWSPANSILMARYQATPQHFVEFSAVTVSLYADEIPLVTVGAEDGNYELAGTITNQTTGEAITVTSVMDLNTELEIDTDLRTVTWLEDNSGQFQAVSLSASRRHWLRLLPGNNTLRFDDVGTGNVTLVMTWEERYY